MSAPTCAFCARELELEGLCCSDDCTSVTAEIEVDRIGELPTDEYGSRDELVLLKRKDYEPLTPAEAEQWMLLRVYRDTDRPGVYFCHSVTALQHPYLKNYCLVLIHHCWDV